MIVKNKIAQPGEIKSVVLDTNQVEVRLQSGKVMLYQRKDLPEEKGSANDCD